MKNTGSTTVTYEWKKIIRGDYIPSKNSDGIQRFYCHYPRDILKPGESKTYIFSFRSEKPGMFNEEWELLTEPQLLETAPLLNLSGMATKADEYIEKRQQLNDVFGRELEKKKTQALSEVEARALTPPPEQVDAQTKLIEHFNATNEHLGIIYS
jgi:hypothetical protein